MDQIHLLGELEGRTGREDWKGGLQGRTGVWERGLRNGREEVGEMAEIVGKTGRWIRLLGDGRVDWEMGDRTGR